MTSRRQVRSYSTKRCPPLEVDWDNSTNNDACPMSIISRNTRNKYTCIHLYAHILKYDNTINKCTQIEGKTPTRFTKFSQWTNTWVTTYRWWWATITTGYLLIYTCCCSFPIFRCFSCNSIMHTKWSTDRFSNISNNRRAYTDDQKDWPFSGQMIIFT